MATYSLTGNDTLILAGRSITDLAMDDNFSISFPSDLADVQAGKGGNAVFAKNESGRIAVISVSLIRGAPDDKFLNGLLASMNQDFASFTTIAGQFVKRVGNGVGGIISDSYLLEGGIFSKQVEAKSNSQGDLTQSLSVYSLKFAKAQRAMF